MSETSRFVSTEDRFSGLNAFISWEGAMATSKQEFLRLVEGILVNTTYHGAKIDFVTLGNVPVDGQFSYLDRSKSYWVLLCVFTVRTSRVPSHFQVRNNGRTYEATIVVPARFLGVPKFNEWLKTRVSFVNTCGLPDTRISNIQQDVRSSSVASGQPESIEHLCGVLRERVKQLEQIVTDLQSDLQHVCFHEFIGIGANSGRASSEVAPHFFLGDIFLF